MIGGAVSNLSPRERGQAPRPRPSRTHVRPLVEDDLEGVADLFLERFRATRKSPRAKAEVASCMKALYLDRPGRAGDADALVAIDSAGAVAAFCGGARARFRFDGRPASVCVTGALMASTAPGHALAAVQILKESRKLGHDLIVTDSANRASLAMCQAIGYQPVSPDSLEWACVFEPASLVLHKIRQRLGAPWLGALKTPGASRRRRGRARPATGREKRETLGLARRGSGRRNLRRDRPALSGRCSDFRPDYTREEFLWLIAMARRRRSAGPLHLQVVYDGAGAPAGAYAAFGGKGDVARVVEAVAAPHAWGRLFDKMRQTARERGCIGAHGSLKRPMMAHAYACAACSSITRAGCSPSPTGPT